MILMLCSQLPQQGKSTIASYLVEKYNFTEIAFADKIKEICYQIGWNGEKDEKGRQLLINIGEISKKYNKDVWINKVIFKILEDKNKDYVISDLRFKEEENRIKELFNDVKIIGIESDKFGDKRFLNNVSQIQYNGIKKDFIIKNNGSLNKLKKSVDKYINM